MKSTIPFSRSMKLCGFGGALLEFRGGPGQKRFKLPSIDKKLPLSKLTIKPFIVHYETARSCLQMAPLVERVPSIAR